VSASSTNEPVTNVPFASTAGIFHFTGMAWLTIGPVSNPTATNPGIFVFIAVSPFRYLFFCARRDRRTSKESSEVRASTSVESVDSERNLT
jgi:hypothetical protein